MTVTAAWRRKLGERLRIGIGIHLGPVILGAMGHGRTVTATATR